MNNSLIFEITRLRLLVGYLGEREQYGWWTSSFFTQGNSAFLNPLFPRSKLLAQCNGVTQAALITHDERIGVGHVFHLFRLPEEMEQSIHQELQNKTFQGFIPDEEATPQIIQDKLGELSSGDNNVSVGPTRIGGIEQIYELPSWKRVAKIYSAAFEAGEQAFPFFSELQ